MRNKIIFFITCLTFSHPFFPLRNSVRSVYFVLTSAAFRFTWNPSLQNEPVRKSHTEVGGGIAWEWQQWEAWCRVGFLLSGNEGIGMSHFLEIILARFAILIYPSCTFWNSVIPGKHQAVFFACGIIWWPFRELCLNCLNPESRSFGRRPAKAKTNQLGSMKSMKK